MIPPKASRPLRPLLLAGACLSGFAVTLAFAQTTPAADAATPPPENAPAAKPAASSDADEPSSNDEVVVLSPFEVRQDTKGYYASNTMSGTRLNTKLEDLASSITVVTKEQMSDFGMLDINDIFLYTGNTEGTGTYTDAMIDRNGQLTDNSQGNPTGANRVRGLAPANISYGNFEMNGRTPIDPLIVDGVEVSRGPNGSIFGLGRPSGTVNQTPLSANLGKNRYNVALRGDDLGGWRATFDINEVLIKQKLAVRINGGRQHDAFTRKPSGFDTKRLDAVFKYRPFKNTTISGSYLFYDGRGNRPNNTPPRDYVSYWLASGKPAWDPVTQLITLNGVTYGANATSSPTSVVANSTIPIPDAILPSYFSRAGGAFQRSNIFIDGGNVTYWTAPVNNTGGTPTADNGQIRLMGPSPQAGASLGKLTNQPLFATTPTVSTKDLYDWDNVNLSAIDQFADKTETYLVTIDQVLLNTERQNLTALLGVFREDQERYRRTPASNSGTSGQTGQLWVDVNIRNLDGTPNPNFGRPYIGVIEPRTTLSPARWDTYRASLAYSLDLSHESNWLKWIGRHQISGYYDFKDQITRQYSYRDVMTSDTGWIVSALSPTIARGNQSSVTGGPQLGPNIMRGFFRYYVGDNVGSNVDYAPTPFRYGSYPFVWGTTGNWRYDPIALGQVATTDGTGGTANTKQYIKTSGVMVQSHLLNDALVTTLGTRIDKVYSKNGLTPQKLLTGDDAKAAGVGDNVAFDYGVIDHWEPNWRYSSGHTSTIGGVLRPFRDLPFASHWAASGGAKGVVGEILRGVSFTYNQSDNFIPQTPAVDLALHELPNVTGKGKDYGFWLNMYDGKLVIRFNHYTNSQFNARNGDANTIAQRVLRHDLDVGQGDAFKLYTVASTWISATNPTLEPDQVKAKTFATIGLDEARYNALAEHYTSNTLAATNDITGKGNEIEINYNPTKNWTVALNANDTRAINSNVSRSIQDYIDERMPIWTTIVDPTITDTQAAAENNPGKLWWIHNYGGSQTAQSNYVSFVDAPYSVIRETQGKSQPSVRRYGVKFSTKLELAAISDNKFIKRFNVGGAIRWEDKGAIGYYGVEQLPAVITHLDPDRPFYDKDHYYFDAFIGYKMKLFNKVGASLKFNVRNIQESGGLKPIAVFPDGTPSVYRIVDPRTFILTASFDL